MTIIDTGAGRQLIELGRRLVDAQRHLVRAAAAFHLAGSWRQESRTAAHWIAEHLDVHIGTAREWIRIGQALAGLPLIDEAFTQNALSYSKVRTLTRIATPSNEAELLEVAEVVPASRLSCALAQWSNQREDEQRRDARHQRDRRFTTWVEPDGMIAGFLRLPPAAGGMVVSAIEARIRRPTDRRRHASPPPGASADAPEWPSLAQQRADALVEALTGDGEAVRTELVIHVRGDGASLDDGTPMTGSVVERLAPESFIRALIHDAEGRPINSSHRRRHPDARQRRVVRERDRACVDCGSTELLEYDHVPDHRSSGQTVVEQLELRCAPCHRRRHGDAA